MGRDSLPRCFVWGCEDVVAAVGFSSLENLRGGKKRSSCCGHSGTDLSNLIPSWALPNPCRQGLVAAQPQHLAQSQAEQVEWLCAEEFGA